MRAVKPQSRRHTTAIWATSRGSCRTCAPLVTLRETLRPRASAAGWASAGIAMLTRSLMRISPSYRRNAGTRPRQLSRFNHRADIPGPTKQPKRGPWHLTVERQALRARRRKRIALHVRLARNENRYLHRQEDRLGVPTQDKFQPHGMCASPHHQKVIAPSLDLLSQLVDRRDVGDLRFQLDTVDGQMC